MISYATRFFCMGLSTVGAAGLVAFSAPSVTIPTPVDAPRAAAVLVAAAPVATLRHG